MRALLENFRVRPEADGGAAPVARLPQILKLCERLAARENLAVEPAAARHLDFEMLRQRVHHRDADAVQAAAGRIDVRVELAAGMQRGHDDLERRLLGKFRVRVHGDAAAVVGDAERAVRFQRDLDEARMPRHGLVHGIVQHLGEEVVQRALVRAADIHAGAAAHRLQPFEHFNVGRGVALAGFGRATSLRAA